MAVSLSVAPLADNHEISFAAIQLSHVECAGPPFFARRQLMSDQYSANCECGLEIVLFADGDAVMQITKVALGAEATHLVPGTFWCDPNQDCVFVVPHP